MGTETRIVIISGKSTFFFLLIDTEHIIIWSGVAVLISQNYFYKSQIIYI